MSNLIPTPRTDKNGNTVIRHMRPVSAPAASGAAIPPVALPKSAGKRTAKLRMEEIAAIFRNPLVASKTRKLLSASTPEELDTLDTVLREYDGMTPLEQKVVKKALRPLTVGRGDTEHVHEILALRSAFCGPWAEENDPAVTGIEDYIYGVRDAFGVSLYHRYSMKFRSEQELNEAVAVTRYLFEMDRRHPRQSFRPADMTYLSGINISYLKFKDPALVALLREYPDRVEDLIEFSGEQQTSGVHALRAYLEHEGASSLSGGYL